MELIHNEMMSDAPYTSEVFAQMCNSKHCENTFKNYTVEPAADDEWLFKAKTKRCGETLRRKVLMIADDLEERNIQPFFYWEKRTKREGGDVVRISKQLYPFWRVLFLLVHQCHSCSYRSQNREDAGEKKEGSKESGRAA